MANKITQERVYELADRLNESGEKVTITSVREANGDYGSPTQISQILKAWRELKKGAGETEKDEIPNLKEKISSSITPLIAKLIYDVTDELIKEKMNLLSNEIEIKEQLNLDLSDYLDKSELIRKSLENKLDDAKKEIEKLNKDIIEVKDFNGNMSIEISNLNQEIKDLNSTNGELKIKIEHKTSQLESHKNQIRTINELCDTHKNKTEELTELVSQNIDTISDLIRERDSLLSEINNLKDINNSTSDNLISMEKNNNALKLEIKKLKQEEAKCQEDIKLQKQEMEKLNDDLKNIKINSNEIKEINSTLLKESELKTNKLTELELELTRYKQHYDEGNKEIAKLASELTTSKTVASELREIISHFKISNKD